MFLGERKRELEPVWQNVNSESGWEVHGCSLYYWDLVSGSLTLFRIQRKMIYRGSFHNWQGLGFWGDLPLSFLDSRNPWWKVWIPMRKKKMKWLKRWVKGKASEGPSPTFWYLPKSPLSHRWQLRSERHRRHDLPISAQVHVLCFESCTNAKGVRKLSTLFTNTEGLSLGQKTDPDSHIQA